jgi:hypothetical protein
MNVALSLNGQVLSFDTTQATWQTKLQDKFAITSVNNVSVFVKRFENKPNAMLLLQNLKGKETKNIPKIYDFVTVQENNKTVYYLFTECLQGKTLKEVIANGEHIDTEKMLDNLLVALQFLHNNGFWFSDFNDENIFVVPLPLNNKKANYFLIDVDSCWDNNIMPANRGIGSMPGKTGNYNLLLYDFYTKVLQKPQFQYSELTGKNINYLQLISVIAHIEFFKKEQKLNSKLNYFAFGIMYSKLYEFILEPNSEYAKRVFSIALQNKVSNSNTDIFVQLAKFIIPKPIPRPSITFFKADKTVVTKNTPQSCEVLLTWEVKNATSLQVADRHIDISQNSLKVYPRETTVYKIYAKNSQGIRVSKSVSIEVIDVIIPPPKPKPKNLVIHNFRVDKHKVKKGEIVTFFWWVENAKKVTIAGIEQVADSNPTNQFRSIVTRKKNYLLEVTDYNDVIHTRNLDIEVEEESYLVVIFFVIAIILLWIWLFTKLKVSSF